MRAITLFATFVLSSSPALADEFDLYVLAGQSNMDGYGKVAELQAEHRGVVEGAVIYHGNPEADGAPNGGRGGLGLWQPLGPGHGRGFKSDGTENHASDAFGLELSFAARLRERLPDRRVAILKYSLGGTSIDARAAGNFGCWEPGFTGGEGEGEGVNQYDHFLATARRALAVRDVDGDGDADRLRPAGILWMQGESDAAYTEEIARGYQANLAQLMDLMRATVRSQDTPVVIGRISDSMRGGKPTWKHGEIVRAAQAAYVAADGAAALVTATDDYGYSDPWHYDTAGYLELGREFADALLSITGAAPANRPPNVVLMFADDQGYADVGVYGARGFETPNLDRLAAEGMRFTDFYVAQPVCSASRAALLTGCYPNRIGIRGALGPKSRFGIADGELTLAELCKSRGYATAIFGKWHLGVQPCFLPMRHGFDEFYGIPYSNDMWPYHPENPSAWGDLPTFELGEVVGKNTDQNQFTTDFTERGVDFIRRSVAAETPFFLYLPHPMPHVPLHVHPDRRGATKQGLYGDVIAEIDWSMGRVLETLEELGVADDTLVIYTSDNGPWLSYGDHAGSTGPLREGKGTTFEGGVRVPCMMRWPGRVPAGSICAEPVMTIDVLPTLAAILDADLPEHPIDGEDIRPLIFGEEGARSPHEALFFWYHDRQLEAMRSGKWKLHFPHGFRSMEGRAPGKGGIPGKYDNARKIELALFDLEADLGETTNVAAQHPEVMARLQALADVARQSLGDKLTKIEGADRRPAGQIGQGN